MHTTRDDIRRWLSAGVELKATYMLVVCDTFEHEDYPAYVLPTDNFVEKHDQYDGKNMWQIVECFDLSLDLEMQLTERRAFHYPLGVPERIAVGAYATYSKIPR